MEPWVSVAILIIIAVQLNRVDKLLIEIRDALKKK